MSSNKISVCVRARPLGEREEKSFGWKIGAKSLTQLDPNTFAPIASQTYAFGVYSSSLCFFFFFLFFFFFFSF